MVIPTRHDSIRLQAQSEDDADDDLPVDSGNAQYMEEFFEQVRERGGGGHHGKGRE